MVMLICRFVLEELFCMYFDCLYALDLFSRVWVGLDEGRRRLMICVSVLDNVCFGFYKWIGM